MKYILNDLGEPVAEHDILKWAEWYESNPNRVVARDELDGVLISTVFLSIDHNFAHTGPPVLWETMIFTRGQAWAAELDDWQKRYFSREDAVIGHAEAVELVSRAQLAARICSSRETEN